MSQKRSNIINETQGDLHLQPSFALVAKKERENGSSVITKYGVHGGYQMCRSRKEAQKRRCKSINVEGRGIPDSLSYQGT